jgi:hypothetical protein
MGQEADPNEALWAQFKDPIMLPLITKVPMGSLLRPFPINPNVEPTLFIQMDSAGGKRFVISLTVQAARKLIVQLERGLEIAGLPIESDSDESPSTH